jgi:phosphoglycerate dehydrogenase-like enzyme
MRESGSEEPATPEEDIMATKDETIGFIGLGAMGRGMAGTA